MEKKFVARFAIWFYAMHLLLLIKKALKATVMVPHLTVWQNNTRVVLAVEDIGDDV